MTTNNSLFEEVTYQRGKEFGLTLTFHRNIDSGLFQFLSNAKPATKVTHSTPEIQNQEMDESGKKKRNNNADIYDCLDKFKETEQLDENNMWYCSACKEHR